VLPSMANDNDSDFEDVTDDDDDDANGIYTQ
jgi:hypothetical protein